MQNIESFELDGVHFLMDFRPGPERGVSTRDEFILVKTRAFLDRYRDLQKHQPKTILEIGMFEGGSLVFFDKLYQPEILVGLDIRDEIAPLEEYRSQREYIHTVYRQSQDDPNLPSLLGEYFPAGIDLIVDDASHQYGPTRAAFENCFPLLRPGGHYVIEDWSWAHKTPSQDAMHPWYEQPALTNLIFELVLHMAHSRHLHQVHVYPELVVVEKGQGSEGGISMDGPKTHLRGRDLGAI